VGLGVGLLVAFPAQRLIQSFLYQVHAFDLWTYVCVLLVLSGIGLVAALLPARKAASIQPMQALRED
jgi:putative ABC transport system permease protein